MSAPNAEQRRHTRAAVSLMGSLTGDGHTQPIVILDLSAGGALLQTHEAPGSATYELEFTVHARGYKVLLDVVSSLELKDAWGWRCEFVDITPEQAHTLERAVHAVIGQATHTMRPWRELEGEAKAGVDTSIIVGQTAAGHDIAVKGRDILEMGAEGLQLYVEVVAGLERM